MSADRKGQFDSGSLTEARWEGMRFEFAYGLGSQMVRMARPLTRRRNPSVGQLTQSSEATEQP